MYLLNGDPISPDEQFESNGISYPAGWIRSATPAEQAAIGIAWVDDEPRPDDFHANVYPDPMEPWKWVSVPYSAEEMVPRLAQYSREKRDQRVLAGVTHTIGGTTYLIPTDAQTRGTFFNYRVIQERPGAPVVTPVELRTGMELVALTLTEIQLRTIEQKMEDRIYNCGITQITLNQGIQDGTVTTKDQIDAAYAAVP